MTTLLCPACGKTIRMEVAAGSSVACPFCGNNATVPEAGVQARRGLSIASMVLGILGIFTSCLPVLGLVGLILGIVAVIKASRRPMECGGRGFAIAGICTGAASLLFMFLALAIFVSTMVREKQSDCAANMSLTSKALTLYANRYNGEYPPSVDALLVANLAMPWVFVCPASQPSSDYDRVMNDFYASKVVTPRMREILQSSYVYIPGQVAPGDPQNVLMYERRGHHPDDGGNVLFADGHVECVRPYSKVEEMVAQTKQRLNSEAPTSRDVLEQDDQQFPPVVNALLHAPGSQAQEIAGRSLCRGNLIMFANAMKIYIKQHGGQYPQSITDVVAYGPSKQPQLVCPALQKERARNADVNGESTESSTPEPDEVMQNCFAYIASQSETSDPMNVLIYEREECHHGKGGNVLFNSWRTKWVEPYSEVLKLVAETKQRLAASTQPASK